MVIPTKGFCQVKKNPKIREKHRSGWVGQARTQILFFLEMLCFFVSFVLFLLFYMFRKKLKIGYGGGWVVSDQSEFFADFWLFFNLTRPLNLTVVIV